MTTNTATVSNQVMWNRLISVVEEQAQALIRTAFSPSVREAGDLSAGVYDTRGQMLAQAVTGTPGHVNAIRKSLPDGSLTGPHDATTLHGHESQRDHPYL